jgi:hypothetical protein
MYTLIPFKNQPIAFHENAVAWRDIKIQNILCVRFLVGTKVAENI